MKIHQLATVRTIGLTSLLLILAWGYSGFAQTPAPPPTLAPPLISLAEARVIIDGAVAFTRDQNLNMAVVVVDAAGNLVSADKMDGTTINNTRFALSEPGFNAWGQKKPIHPFSFRSLGGFPRKRGWHRLFVAPRPYGFGEVRVATLALLIFTALSVWRSCGVVITKFSDHVVTFRSSPTVFADTPVPASASTCILAGKPPRAMSSAAMLLHLYRGIGSSLIARPLNS
jgi:hypothetical protein